MGQRATAAKFDLALAETVAHLERGLRVLLIRCSRVFLQAGLRPAERHIARIHSVGFPRRPIGSRIEIDEARPQGICRKRRRHSVCVELKSALVLVLKHKLVERARIRRPVPERAAAWGHSVDQTDLFRAEVEVLLALRTKRLFQIQKPYTRYTIRADAGDLTGNDVRSAIHIVCRSIQQNLERDLWLRSQIRERVQQEGQRPRYVWCGKRCTGDPIIVTLTVSVIAAFKLSYGTCGKVWKCHIVVRSSRDYTFARRQEIIGLRCGTSAVGEVRELSVRINRPDGHNSPQGRSLAGDVSWLIRNLTLGFGRVPFFIRPRRFSIVTCGDDHEHTCIRCCTNCVFERGVTINVSPQRHVDNGRPLIHSILNCCNEISVVVDAVVILAFAAATARRIRSNIQNG